MRHILSVLVTISRATVDHGMVPGEGGRGREREGGREGEGGGGGGGGGEGGEGMSVCLSRVLQMWLRTMHT